ncbi:MAG: hypothetical protein HPY64_02585 [Anaerolineae bacterium]|nr:hypothetical protein [Anaerolineae bacterium]
MSQHQGFVYQIVALRRGQDGLERRARLGHRPFLIGSGAAADLCLEGEPIRAVQARLFLTTTGQVMLTNLGEAGAITLDGVALPSFACIPWKPGAVLAIGAYDLRLGTLRAEGEDGDLEIIDFPVITQENRAVEDEAALPEEAAASPAKVVSPPPREAFVSAFGHAAPEPDKPAERQAADAGDSAAGEDQAPAAPVEAVAPATPVARPPDALAVYEDGSTYLPAHPLPAAAPGAGAALFSTLPKDWQYTGLFGVQLPVPVVSLVAGERVRVPISLRNGYAEELRLHVAVEGVPPEWVLGPQSLVTLAAGEIQTIDLVLQTQPSPALEQVRELHIRFVDRSTPQVMAAATLTLSFKDEPNLVGRLEPVEAVETRPVHLLLQNHTQAATEIFITARATDREHLLVTPQQAQLRLPPGGSVQVGVTFQVLRRPWLRSVTCDYSLTVTHSHRAPLDYPGRVRLRPRLWPPWLWR